MAPPQYIVDRRTRIYHRPDCPELPPPEFRVRIDRRMLELTRSLNTPCEVCKPEGGGAPPAGASGEPPPERGPLPLPSEE